MTIFFCLLGLLFLGERIGKYLLINYFFRQPSSTTKESLKPEELQVSILQPILSGDPTLWDCLSRNLEMKTCYTTEFLWLIDDDDAVAHLGCRQLIEQYPDANVRLISLPPPLDEISPKTFKLIEGLKEANGDIIAVLDDDTILPDGGLEQCLPFLEQPEVGVAFGLPYYLNFSNLWSTLVSCVVNGNSL
ncbi:MAG: glycosyltransferase, partial [Moorea sp. SIO2B7]|nr:glycosyltransferase [Moorena sp. SIO2B7]